MLGTGTFSQASFSALPRDISIVFGIVNILSVGTLTVTPNAIWSAEGNVTASSNLILYPHIIASGESSPEGNASLTIDGDRTRLVYVNITSNASLVASANAIWSGSANVTTRASIYGNGFVIGQEWSDSATGSETWTDQSTGSETWVEDTPETNTWLRQG